GMWEVATGKEAGSWTLPSEAKRPCCSPDGKTAAYFLGNSVILHDLATKTEKRRWPDAKLRSLAFSPDGECLAAWGHHGLRLWEVAGAKELFSWGRIVDSRVIFSCDGQRLAWTGYDEKSISYPWLMDIGQAQPRRLGLPINNTFGDLAISPDGTTLAVG